MRLRINLETTPNQWIPKHYQAPLRSAIYKILGSGNADYGTWLHNGGFKLDSKSYKLFTFSKLMWEKPFKVHPSKPLIQLGNPKASLILSFVTNEALNIFVKGVFRSEMISIGLPNMPRTDFRVTGVETLATPNFGEKATFRTVNPICITLRTPDNQTAHLSPLEEGYNFQFFNNLKEKYKAALQAGLIHEEDGVLDSDFRLSLHATPIEHKFITKHPNQYNTRPIKHKGYQFEFTLTAHPTLLRLGYYAGFGVQNPCGMGFSKLLNS